MAQGGEGIRGAVLIVATGHEEDRAFDVEGGQGCQPGEARGGAISASPAR